MPCLTELAPAKLNLALSVGPIDARGMHPICSWMITIDLCDELELRALASGSLSRYAIVWHDDARRRSDIDWSITRDLAVRAHLALENYTGRLLPVQMKLSKRIPVGSGLGGGSSNAAAMLRGVNHLYDLNLSSSELGAIAATLGSDVAFFITGGSAVVTGIGDEIETHERAAALHAVLVLPEARCATAAVYRRFDELASQASLRRESVVQLCAMASTSQLADILFNDLSEAAVATAPPLRRYLEEITKIADRPAHITGSGSSLFIICDDPLHAAALAQSIEQQLNLPALAVRTHEHAHEHTIG